MTLTIYSVPLSNFVSSPNSLDSLCDKVHVIIIIIGYTLKWLEDVIMEEVILMIAFYHAFQVTWY